MKLFVALCLLAVLLIPSVCSAQTNVRALGGNVEIGQATWILIEINAPAAIKRIKGTFSFNSTRLQLLQVVPGTALIPFGSNAEVWITPSPDPNRIGFEMTMLNGATLCCAGQQLHFLAIKMRERAGSSGTALIGFDDSLFAREIEYVTATRPSETWTGGSVTTVPYGSMGYLSPGSTIVFIGQARDVPIILEAPNGGSALSFTFLTVPSHYAVESITLGPDAPGGILNVNSNNPSRVGVVMSMPIGQSFQPGKQNHILNIRIRALAPVMNDISYLFIGDNPVAREFVSASAQTLPIVIGPNATVFIGQGLEADVSPRPESNYSVSLQDFVQIGRFAALLDVAAYGLEFQKADCAPKESLGDGRISLADFVQAGRYAASLDATRFAGGPSAPTSFAPEGNLAVSNRARPDLHTRTILLTPVPSRKADITYSVELHNGEGDENAVSFSLELPKSMRFISAEPDDPGAAFHVNQSVPGKIGIILAAQPGQGLGRRLLTLRFEGKGEVTFVEGGELVDVGAVEVGVTFGVPSETPKRRLNNEN